VKPVTDPSVIDRAWKQFTHVFDHGWTIRNPRLLPKSALPGERLLYPQGYELSDEVFAALHAAATVYDEPYYYLNMTEYNPDQPQLWTVDWSEDSDVLPSGDLNLLENAIFSPSGHWGVWLTQTDIAVMAGEAVDSRGRPDDYLRELLSRYYERDEADRLIQTVVASRQTPGS
jgi:hypothetical protein